MESPAALWTNEKHVIFLNSMEASFVRTMFENGDHCDHHLRLDRRLPDSGDSTLDSPASRKKQATAGGGRMDGRAGSRSRSRSSRPYDSTQDQVVPQMQKRGGGTGDDDERERDHPN